ncbi:MAG: aminopeptidase P family protein [Solobacterium sp.]|nr:aminopeptidase P family protein [Solobacterium sp.]
MNTNEKITALRELMREKGIDVCYIPNEDDHLSAEYTADYYKSKSYISGFSGEAGCVIVTQDFAGLWTDGRYFTQAENELEGTCVELMRMRQEGVPDPIDFLIEQTPEGGKAGYDGSVVSARDSIRISNELRKKNASLHISDDLAGMVWGSERPAMPKEKLFLLEQEYTGESASERIRRVREAMKAEDAGLLILTALEDPCWLFNIRGNDIACTPVAYAFAAVSMDSTVYYVDRDKLTEEVYAYLSASGVEIRPYEALAEDLKAVRDTRVMCSLDSLNTKLYACLGSDNRIINTISPVARFRAVKNETEIRNIRNAHIKDGAAMVRFIKWIRETAPADELDEVKAQNHLYELRAAQPLYIEPSFPTICAYQENGAMMHYSAAEGNCSRIRPRGFLLVDSGGTYKDGTTDITRTISLGFLTDEEKMLYTRVLKGHLALARARFLYGTTGNNLDILARGPVWDIDIDYQCGTGHGVGHVLSVHEGPHGIRWGRPLPGRPNAVLEEGMIVTNEPGVYMPHKLGIRIENELLVQKGTKNFYGQFLYFDDITLCPYEKDAIDLSLLNDEEIRQINAYHAHVYEMLSPLLNEEEREWLKKETEAL